MDKIHIKRDRYFVLGGIILVLMGLAFPFAAQTVWFEVAYKIRKAIHVGDSGHLILASASMSFLYAIQSTCLFLGAVLTVYYTELKLKTNRMLVSLVLMLTIVLLHWISTSISYLSWEPVSTILALVIALAIFQKLFGETNSFIHVSIVSIQIFFAFQWLNIMPLFSFNYIGQSDIPSSIKTAGLYLQAASVLNFSGFAFFLPFIFSTFITTTLFISYSKNIRMMKVNYEKEREIQKMKAKALENRIFKEVKSLVHDLKTPLVTIKGLNSLLSVSKEKEKLEEYSGRIDNSVDKMSEMISSFLYETSRQRLQAIELISYIRAQLPMEDETIKIDIELAEELPDIYINKVRVARAVINILENAILVPCEQSYKHIIFEAKPIDNKLLLTIKDNGIGIREEHLSHIWEVGFSTNNTSGLGLPFAKQVIEDNEGSIALSSELGRGTLVTIGLPCFDVSLKDIC